MSPQLAAFFTTCVVEAIGAVLVVPLLRPSATARLPTRLVAALAAILGSVLTHPLVWWLNQHWALMGGWALKVTVLELAAAVVEAVAYRALLGLPWGQAFIASVAINALSFGVGLTLYAAGALPT